MGDEGFWFPTPPHLRKGGRKYARDTRSATHCKYPDCPAPRRRVQGAGYCEEHAVTRRGDIARAITRLTVECRRCSRSYVLARKDSRSPQRAAWEDFCPDCRNATPLRLVQLVAHRVPADLVHSWVGGGTDLGCGLCGRVFHKTGMDPVLDHDHACCAGDKSCGSCVRGVVCTGCNIRLGMFEWIVKNNVLPNFIAWIGANSVSPSTIVGQWARNPEEESIKEPEFLKVGGFQ